MNPSFYRIVQDWSELPEEEMRAAAQQAVAADPDLLFRRNTEGVTLLWRAAERDNLIIVKALLDLGAEVDAHGTESLYATTPLKFAVKWGDIALASLLLQRGADPNLGVYSPPIFAISNGDRPALLDLLLKYGADPFARDSDGRTVLFGASEDMALRYLEMGVDVNARDNQGRTAAESYVDYSTMFELLVTHGADPNCTDENGFSVLHHTASVSLEPRPATIRKLVSLGADPEARTPLGLTPMHYAASVFAAPYVSALMKCGADINARDNEGRTPRRYVEDGIYLGEHEFGEAEEIGGMSPREYTRKRAKMLAFLDTVGARL